MNIIKLLISLLLIIPLVTINAQVVVEDDVNCSDSIEVKGQLEDIRMEQREMNTNAKNQLIYLEKLIEFNERSYSDTIQ